MLSLQTVQPDTLELLKTLMRLPILSDMRLVGGTALALQYGHRRSVDLDFFGHTTENVDELTEAIREEVGHIQTLSATKRIKVYNIQNVKVDIVNYDYPWIDDAVIEGDIRMASPKDIAAMKVNAVIGLGTKKDFIDIFFLLQHYTFDELLQFYKKKYPDGSEFRALLSMAFFADADLQAMPYMYENIEWSDIKQRIRKEQEQYNNNNK